MKLITEVNDDTLFLKRLYESADAIKGFLEKTKILDANSKRPVLNGDETLEEKLQKFRKQAISNFTEMARIACMEYPEETVSLVRNLVILEDGEDYPHGIALFGVIGRILANKELLDFFTSLGLWADSGSKN